MCITGVCLNEDKFRIINDDSKQKIVNELVVNMFSVGSYLLIRNIYKP